MSDDEERKRILERRAMWIAGAVGVVGVGGVIAFRELGSRVEVAACLSVSRFGSVDPSAAPAENTVFSAVVNVYGDDHQPVDGARVLHYGLLVGTTGTSGRTSIELRGARSEVAELVVECPEGFETPVKLSIALVPGMLEVTATCKLIRDAKR